MIRRVGHRGPDGEGTWFHRADDGPGPSVGLAHRRLALVDLSPAASQPMTNEDGRFTIVFNGEIYNHVALRVDLSKRHPFRSRSDTEVLLHGWEEEGSAFLDRVDGMFAFAIWDAHDASLTLARDRIGEKPLIYAWVNDEFLFASELGALLADPAFPREIDPEALEHYLAWNAIPAPSTIFQAARKLRPGHLLRIVGGKEEDRAFWTPQPAPNPPADRTEARARLRSALEESVSIRLRGDVPVGAFLSGGIDSSIIVGLAARASSGPLRTFSVGFEGNSPFDERPHAREVARMHGTLHTEIVLDPREAITEMGSFLETMDEPFGDSSAVPTSLISKHTGAQVKVALSGDGADELFAGYWKYVAESIATPYGRIPGGVRAVIARAAARLPENRRSAAGESVRRFRKFFTRFEADPAARHVAWMTIFNARQRAELLGPPEGHNASCVEESVKRLYREAGDSDVLGAMLYTDLRHTLPTDMLTKVDRMSMRHGLEVRLPYLHPEVVSLSLAFPSGWKLEGTRRKAILVDTFADLIPPNLRNRPKRGFEIPVAEWFRGDLRPLLEDTLSERSLRQQTLLNLKTVRTLVDEHTSRRANHAPRLWSLLVLCTWLRRINGSGESSVIRCAGEKELLARPAANSDRAKVVF
jgi:asparagine synthase (glutamine-hydrolysing)